MTRSVGGAVVAAAILFVSCSGEDAPAPDPDSFFAEWSLLARSAEQQGTATVAGLDGWLFFGPELRHLGVGKFWGDRASAVSQARRPEWADPLPVLLDFHRQLASADVELVIVPVPPKAIIYPEKLPTSAELSDPPPRLDNHHQAFYEVLRQNGVTVLDLTSVFLSNRQHPRGPLYCRQDTHWSGSGTVLASKRIAAEVRSRPWFEDEPKELFQREWKTVEIAGDLWKALDESPGDKEKLSLRFVRSDSQEGQVEPDPTSPVVLMGDSHTLVFHAGGDMHALGAGIVDQLALELGFAMDLIGVRGSGATAARINLMRRARATNDFWRHKRLVIWCFSARELTESDGWRQIPIE